MTKIKYLAFGVLFLFHSLGFAEPAIPSFEMPTPLQVAYKSPTLRFNDFHNYEYILYSLKGNGLSLEHRNFFEHIIPHEELGCFGYHSSTQGFRIFQDIIRIVLEEICQLEIKQDFHFLRVPGKPLLSRPSAQQFLNDYPIVNNNIPDQQEQLLSMNYALFGNFTNFGSCSVYYFTANHSATTVGFQAKLAFLFESVGLPSNALPELFKIGNSLMATENAVLFQFFDFSHHNGFHEPYQLVDQMCYTAFPGGTPYALNKKMSELFLGIQPQHFTDQFRLVINNSRILNPHSPLAIKRYERSDPQLVEDYESQLRTAIRSLPHDSAKAKQYRALLIDLWEQTDE